MEGLGRVWLMIARTSYTSPTRISAGEEEGTASGPDATLLVVRVRAMRLATCGVSTTAQRALGANKALATRRTASISVECVLWGYGAPGHPDELELAPHRWRMRSSMAWH